MIPFNLPFNSNTALERLRETLASQRLSGNGKVTRQCAELLCEITGAQGAFLTPSCTAALEMSALLLELEPGQEVIVPSFTFVSSACAYALMGARPVFADVSPQTLNLDADAVERAITRSTRAVVAVHYAGVACPMDRLVEICQRHNLTLIEDNAHGLFGTYHGKALGTFGAMSTLSFHETKNVSCGEGGALLINDPALLERAAIAQEKGTNRSSFLMGMIDKYTWISKGSSYLLGEVPATLLLSNLIDREVSQRRRLAIWERYQSELQAWAQRRGTCQPYLPPGTCHPAHLYFLLLRDLEERQGFLEHLKRRSVHAVFHYQPLHLSPMGRGYGGVPGQCPVAEKVANQLVRLPLYADLTPQEQDRIIEAVLSWD
jgi:dTDP-4-amino-4,6-dideoxygalactose transaminase